jgi:hypothetical protein
MHNCVHRMLAVHTKRPSYRNSNDCPNSQFVTDQNIPKTLVSMDKKQQPQEDHAQGLRTRREAYFRQKQQQPQRTFSLFFVCEQKKKKRAKSKTVSSHPSPGASPSMKQKKFACVNTQFQKQALLFSPANPNSRSTISITRFGALSSFMSST